MIIPKPERDRSIVKQIARPFEPFSVNLWVMIIVVSLAVGLNDHFLRREDDGATGRAGQIKSAALGGILTRTPIM